MMVMAKEITRQLSAELASLLKKEHIKMWKHLREDLYNNSKPWRNLLDATSEQHSEHKGVEGK